MSEKSKSSDFWMTLLGVPLALPIVLFQLWMDGFCLANVWAWHVVPWLHLKPITWVQFAVGQICWLIFRGPRQPTDESKRGQHAALCLIYPWLFLALAWVLR